VDVRPHYFCDLLSVAFLHCNGVVIFEISLTPSEDLAVVRLAGSVRQDDADKSMVGFWLRNRILAIAEFSEGKVSLLVL
jgi:hypothetical protein